MRLPWKKQPAAGVPANAPPTAFERARIEWFERYGSAIVDKNRAYVLTLALTLAVAALGFALASVTPLKTVVPYIIKVADNGSAVPVSRASPSGATFSPSG
jgi:type IV secretory pathway TrbF-like protein